MPQKNSFKKIFNLQSKKAGGFSLIETLIAVFIFSLIMVMLSGSFSSFLRNFANAKKMQKSFENAQYAVNLMSKTIRTSSLISATATSLIIYDYSQTSCIKYEWVNSNNIQVSKAATDLNGCKVAPAFSAPVFLTANNIQSMSITGVASDASAGTVGKVTVALMVRTDGQTTSALPLQTTVSLRK